MTIDEIVKREREAWIAAEWPRYYLLAAIDRSWIDDWLRHREIGLRRGIEVGREMTAKERELLTFCLTTKWDLHSVMYGLVRAVAQKREP